MKYIIIRNELNSKTLSIKIKLQKLLKQLKWEKNSDPEYAFVIGGDGTLLKSFGRLFSNNKKLIFIPIRCTRIGFYYSYSFKEIKNIIINLSKGDKSYIHKVDLLKIATVNDTYYALNEVKIIKNDSPIKMDLNINGKLLNHIYATGIIVSTENGSTGIMKSVGGSVVLLGQSTLQLKVIAPVNTKYENFIPESLVISEKNEIMLSEIKKEYSLVIDNNELKCNDNLIRITISKEQLFLIKRIDDLEHKLNLLKTIFIM